MPSKFLVCELHQIWEEKLVRNGMHVDVEEHGLKAARLDANMVVAFVEVDSVRVAVIIFVFRGVDVSQHLVHNAAFIIRECDDCFVSLLLAVRIRKRRLAKKSCFAHLEPTCAGLEKEVTPRADNDFMDVPSPIRASHNEVAELRILKLSANVYQ